MAPSIGVAHTIRSILAVASCAAAVACHAAPASDPQAAFGKHCARCHSAEAVDKKVARHPAEGRAAWLEKFLGSHFPPDEPTRKALAQWLDDRARDAKAGR